MREKSNNFVTKVLTGGTIVTRKIFILGKLKNHMNIIEIMKYAIAAQEAQKVTETRIRSALLEKIYEKVK